jgi:hypothetical protein
VLQVKFYTKGLAVLKALPSAFPARPFPEDLAIVEPYQVVENGKVLTLHPSLELTLREFVSGKPWLELANVSLFERDNIEIMITLSAAARVHLLPSYMKCAVLFDPVMTQATACALHLLVSPTHPRWDVFSIVDEKEQWNYQPTWRRHHEAIKRALNASQKEVVRLFLDFAHSRSEVVTDRDMTGLGEMSSEWH